MEMHSRAILQRVQYQMATLHRALVAHVQDKGGRGRGGCRRLFPGSTCGFVDVVRFQSYVGTVTKLSRAGWRHSSLPLAIPSTHEHFFERHLWPPHRLLGCEEFRALDRLGGHPDVWVGSRALVRWTFFYGSPQAGPRKLNTLSDQFAFLANY